MATDIDSLSAETGRFLEDRIYVNVIRNAEKNAVSGELGSDWDQYTKEELTRRLYGDKAVTKGSDGLLKLNQGFENAVIGEARDAGGDNYFINEEVMNRNGLSREQALDRADAFLARQPYPSVEQEAAAVKADAELGYLKSIGKKVDVSEMDPAVRTERENSIPLYVTHHGYNPDGSVVRGPKGGLPKNPIHAMIGRESADSPTWFEKYGVRAKWDLSMPATVETENGPRVVVGVWRVPAQAVRDNPEFAAEVAKFRSPEAAQALLRERDTPPAKGSLDAVDQQFRRAAVMVRDADKREAFLKQHGGPIQLGRGERAEAAVRAQLVGMTMKQLEEVYKATKEAAIQGRTRLAKIQESHHEKKKEFKDFSDWREQKIKDGTLGNQRFTVEEINRTHLRLGLILEGLSKEMNYVQYGTSEGNYMGDKDKERLLKTSSNGRIITLPKEPFEKDVLPGARVLALRTIDAVYRAHPENLRDPETNEVKSLQNPEQVRKYEEARAKRMAQEAETLIAREAGAKVKGNEQSRPAVEPVVPRQGLPRLGQPVTADTGSSSAPPAPDRKGGLSPAAQSVIGGLGRGLGKPV